MSIRIDAAWGGNRKLYGACKIWHVLRREGEDLARCTAERVMRRLGIRGVVRGKKVITTQPDISQPCPDDKVNRLFLADRPNKLWVSDFTFAPTWSGTVYVVPSPWSLGPVAFPWLDPRCLCPTDPGLACLDVDEDPSRPRRIAAGHMAKKTPDNKSLARHSDRPSHGLQANRCRVTGSQDRSIMYPESLAEAEIDRKAGTAGGAHDNALAEGVIGPFKTEVINQIRP